MFLAIIMETYNSVKSEITQGRSQLGNYIYKKLHYWFFYIIHCGRKRQLRDFTKRTQAQEEFPDEPIASVRNKSSYFQKQMTANEYVLRNRITILNINSMKCLQSSIL